MLRSPRRFIPPLGAPRATARQKALAALRGVDLAPLEAIRQRPAWAAGDVLNGVLTEIRIDRRQSEAEIARVWNSLMDPRVTAHARPTGIHKGTLFVSVDSNTWHAEIVRYHRREILQRLQHSFGPDLIQRISFRIE